MKKILPLILLLLFYLIFQLYLPGMVENEIKESLENYVDEVEGLKVEVSSFPVWEIITKNKVDKLQIKSDSFVIEGLKFEDFQGEYTNVSYKEEIISGENTDLDFYLTESALNRYMKDNYTALENFDIDLKTQSVNLNGKIKIFSTDILIKLTGNFSINEVNNIVYKPGEFTVEEMEIPLSLIKEFAGDMSFTIDLNEYEIPIRVEKLLIEDDRIELKGGKSAGKAG